MNSYFAKPERANKRELVEEIEIASKSPVMSGLLHSVSGSLAVLDEYRQIVALNDSFLKSLGIDDSAEALGLRPGEALHCIHAYEEPGGCGTSKFCSTCGAAIAIVTSLAKDKPVERFCALTVNRGELTIDIALLVRSCPIEIDGKRFLLLFLQDISSQQQKAALERTFFHDVNNLLSGLVGTSELLFHENNQSNLVKMIYQSALRLKKEVEMQRCLLQSDSCVYQPLWQKISTTQVIEELQSFFANHPAATNKKLHFQVSYPVMSFQTDISLLLRVLCNMVTNALEATDKSGEVKIWLENNDNFLSFCVLNHKPISQDISRRIFQRNFSTKDGSGRGIGTYSMKLFGEYVLGGQVSFTTSQKKGTVFRFSLPLSQSSENLVNNNSTH